MWNLVLVHLEIVLVSLQDRCMVCTKRTRGSEIVLDARSKVTRPKWKLASVHLEIVLTLTQDSCMVCAKHTISSEIIFGAPDGTLM
jgi:hypothetical protein